MLLIIECMWQPPDCLVNLLLPRLVCHVPRQEVERLIRRPHPLKAAEAPHRHTQDDDRIHGRDDCARCIAELVAPARARVNAGDAV
eukprot:scaffold304574_cov33-Tisochrysis_lutea.AAC.2